MNANLGSYAPSGFVGNIPDDDPIAFDFGYWSTLGPCQQQGTAPCIDGAIWESTVVPDPLFTTSDYGENGSYFYGTNDDERSTISVGKIIAIVIGACFFCWLFSFFRYLQFMEEARHEESESRITNQRPSTIQQVNSNPESPNNRGPSMSDRQQIQQSKNTAKESRVLTPTEFEELLLHTMYSDEKSPTSCRSQKSQDNGATTKTASLISEKETQFDETKRLGIPIKSEDLRTLDDTNTCPNVYMQPEINRSMNSNLDPESLVVFHELQIKGSSNLVCGTSSSTTKKHIEDNSHEKEDGTPDSCCICYDEFSNADLITLLPNCMHSFHTRCIREWLLGAKSTYCPLCKTGVKHQ